MQILKLYKDSPVAFSTATLARTFAAVIGLHVTIIVSEIVVQPVTLKIEQLAVWLLVFFIIKMIVLPADYLLQKKHTKRIAESEINQPEPRFFSRIIVHNIEKIGVWPELASLYLSIPVVTLYTIYVATISIPFMTFLVLILLGVGLIQTQVNSRLFILINRTQKFRARIGNLELKERREKNYWKIMQKEQDYRSRLTVLDEIMTNVPMAVNLILMAAWVGMFQVKSSSDISGLFFVGLYFSAVQHQFVTSHSLAARWRKYESQK